MRQFFLHSLILATAAEEGTEGIGSVRPEAKETLEYCPAATAGRPPRGWLLPVPLPCRRPIVASCQPSLPAPVGTLGYHVTSTRSRCRRLPAHYVLLHYCVLLGFQTSRYLLLQPTNYPGVHFIYVPLAIWLQHRSSPDCLPEVLDICSTPEHGCNSLPHKTRCML